MTMKSTTEKQPTAQQLADAYAAVRENAHLMPALKNAGIDWNTFAMNVGPTLERLEAFRAARK